ncbi:uncharacterized protein LOC116417839 [Nasonia vitripennis]|uniref:Myb/SANT-like DNA-binding domain-containing protein n=1 Tax=Nasonia vitripennis TaxID=7425 RepID=A0A7M7QJW5_NASVI|nr:uncharacterized protein LOC116417839 [Nasonia vitripennis]
MANYTEKITFYDPATHENIILRVTEETARRAKEDLLFATKLLEEYKAAVVKQSENAVLTNFTKDDVSAIASSSQLVPNNNEKTGMPLNRTKLIPLQLFEEDAGIMYTLQLSPDLHSRAVNDIIFAQKLLNDYKKSQNNKPLPLLNQESYEEKLEYEMNYEDLENIEKNDVKENESTENTKQNSAYKWNEKDGKLLLAFYKESQEKFDNGSLTSKKFYTNIVNKLKEKGYTVTMKQCITKMDCFKRS